MKKILCILLTLALLLPALASCDFSFMDPQGTTTASGPDNTPIKVGLLSGTTGMGAAKLWADADPRYTFELYGTAPDTLVSDLASGAVTMAALPTNAAAIYSNRTNGKIKVLALNTLGVLYVLDRTGTVSSLADLAGKDVYVPMPGQNPQYIVEHILDENGIEANLHVGMTADELATALLSNEGEFANIQIAVLPQPKVTVVQMQATQQGITDLTVPINLSTEWDKIEDTPIPQGCLVANAKFCEEHPAAVAEFLAAYKASIEYMSAPATLDAAAALVVEKGIIPKLPIAKAALPKCSLAYLDGAEMKEALTSFYTILYAANPQSVGGALPTDAFYYIP